MEREIEKLKITLPKRVEKVQNINAKKTILDFMKALKIGYNIKPVKIKTIESYTDILIQINKTYPTKDFIEYTKFDLIVYFNEREDKGFAKISINLHKVRLKNFFTWLYREKGLCDRDKIPEIISWIQISKKYEPTKSIEDIFTPSQIQSLINATDKLRDKCLIGLGFEGGFRISELLDIKIKDVFINSNHAYIEYSGKTGHGKKIIIESYPHLLNWIENHPFKNNKEQYLFISLAHNYYGNQLYASTVGSILRSLAKRCNIKKNKITPHVVFRHSRLTYLASTLNWNEARLKSFANWSKDSSMTKVYCHGTEKDVFNSLMFEAGIMEDKNSIENIKEKEALKPIICPRCSRINPAGSLYCNCGLCINYNEAQTIDSKKTEAITEATNILMEIMADPERLEKFMKFKDTQKIL